MLYNKIKALTSKRSLLGNKRAFFDALKIADSRAIQLLAREITYNIRKAALGAGLREEDSEEIINDAIVITLSNIRSGKMTFMDYSPVAYATGVARKLIANRNRSRKPMTEDLDQVDLASEFDPELYLDRKEREKLVGQLMARLGESCRQLIQLKFFQQLKDQEVIDQKLTGYNSAATLKSKRSQCMKKLMAMAKESGGKTQFGFG